MTKPVIFSDLDDTLFQTRRKMVGAQFSPPYKTAAVDRSMTPRSFMSAEQAMLVEWLLTNADLIPVTARGTEEISRVHLPFRSWAITTHGAVILRPDGQPDEHWQAHTLPRLSPYAERLIAMQPAITALMAARGVDAWARINYEYHDIPVCLVMKHRDSTKLAQLNTIADEIEHLFSTTGFTIQRNNNNITWLPQVIDKGHAVSWLLTKLREERGLFPVIALGDSLSDYRFMKLCHWFALPQQSQFATAIARHIFGEEE